MMLQVNSPFANEPANRTDLSQQLKESIDECNRLRQALHTLNDSSLNYKNNAERALELAKKEMVSLKGQISAASTSKEEMNKLRAQIVRLQRGHKSAQNSQAREIAELETTIAQLRDEVQDAQETIHKQRVKFQSASREKNQQLLEYRDNIRTLKQKLAHASKENEQLSGFLKKEQEQSERGRDLISRLEEMVQRLSEAAPPLPTNNRALTEEKEQKYKAIVSLLQKEKQELTADNQHLLAQLAEAEVKHADEIQAATEERKESELRLLNHITALRAEVTKLKGGGDHSGTAADPAPTNLSAATMNQSLPATQRTSAHKYVSHCPSTSHPCFFLLVVMAEDEAGDTQKLNPQTLLERARRRKELAAGSTPAS